MKGPKLVLGDIFKAGSTSLKHHSNTQVLACIDTTIVEETFALCLFIYCMQLNNNNALCRYCNAMHNSVSSFLK